MLIDPDGFIALLREHSERDLALLAIIAGMRDSEDEAIERLTEQEEAMRDYLKTLNRSKQHRQHAMVKRAIEIIPRLRSAIEQVRDRAAT